MLHLPLQNKNNIVHEAFDTMECVTELKAEFFPIYFTSLILFVCLFCDYF